MHNANNGGDPGHSRHYDDSVIVRQHSDGAGSIADVTDAHLVADFYDACVDQARWPATLSHVGEALGADACALVRRDFGENRGAFLHAVGVGAAEREAYDVRFGRQDPWLIDGRTWEPAAVFGGSDTVSTGLLVASDFYRDWLAPIDLLHAAFVVLDRHDQQAVLLAVYRRSQRPAFQADELAPLRGVAPRLAGAYHLGRELARQRCGHRAAVAALDAMPIGVITLDRRGGVIETNRFADAVLAGGEGIVRTDAGLVLERPGLRLRLRDVIAQGAAARRRGGLAEVPLFALPRYRQRRPLTCLVSLLLQDQDAVGAEDEASVVAAVVYVGDPDRSVRFEPQRLSRLYGLSRAEARVAALVARGMRLEETADQLGIAYETVRKHLKQIFIKTGVSRQAELVRLLVTGPGGMAVSAPVVDRDDA
jgi:DNA-binding CsgD family transcriptional regulator/PAS domain-containing protein